MAMTDKQKLTFAISKFKEKLFSIPEWTDFVSMVSSISPSKIKTFLKNNLQKEIDKRRQAAINETAMADALEALKDEINSI